FTRAAVFICACLFCTAAFAQGGHGPVFAYATPTNSQGEWSFDVGALGRSTSGNTQITARTMVGYGFTPYVTVWMTVPATFGGGNKLGSTVQAGGCDFERWMLWRFYCITINEG